MGNPRGNKHDRLSREIAKTLPERPKGLRATWLALAYRVDWDTHILNGWTEPNIIKEGRKRADSSTSVATLRRFLPELEKRGLVKVEHNYSGLKRLPSTYYLNFSGEPKANGQDDPEWQAWQDQIQELAEAVEVTERYEPDEGSKCDSWEIDYCTPCLAKHPEIANGEITEEASAGHDASAFLNRPPLPAYDG